jgi:predicted cupin superfamily sugar epimerase
MPASAEDWIRSLGLVPHREGGRFRETWRSADRAPASAWPSRFRGERALGTAIVYLLMAGEHSRLHRLHADELWHLYDGGPLHLHVIQADGAYQRLVLGRDPESGERPQAVVPHGCWFGAEPAPAAAFALAGCTVSPGFEYEDFEAGERAELLRAHPQHRALIERLTDERGSGT